MKLILKILIPFAVIFHFMTAFLLNFLIFNSPSEPKNPSFKKIGDRIQYNVQWSFNNEPRHFVTDLEYIGDTLIKGNTINILKGYSLNVSKDKTEEELVLLNIEDDKIINLTYADEENIIRDSYPNLEIDKFSLRLTSYRNQSLFGKKFAYIHDFFTIPFLGAGVTKYFIDFPYPIKYPFIGDLKVNYLKVDGVEYGEKFIFPESSFNGLITSSYSNGKVFVKFRLNHEYDVTLKILENNDSTIYEEDFESLGKGERIEAIDIADKISGVDSVTVLLEYVKVMYQFEFYEFKEVIKIE